MEESWWIHLKKSGILFLGIAGLSLSLIACGNQKANEETKSTTESNSKVDDSSKTEESTAFSVDKNEIISAIVKTAALTFDDLKISSSFNQEKQQLELNLDEAAKNDDLKNNEQLKESIISDAVSVYENCEKDFGIMYPIVGILDGNEVFKIDKGDVVENHL